MKIFRLPSALAVLLIALLAFAAAAQSKSQLLTEVGEITSLDWRNGSLVLDTGTQYALPSMFMYTTVPAVGQRVKIWYVEEGGRRVVRSVEIGSQTGN